MTTTKGTSMDDGNESDRTERNRLEVDLHPLELEALRDVPEEGRRNGRVAFTMTHRPEDVADANRAEKDEGGVSQ